MGYFNLRRRLSNSDSAFEKVHLFVLVLFEVLPSARRAWGKVTDCSGKYIHLYWAANNRIIWDILHVRPRPISYASTGSHRARNIIKSCSSTTSEVNITIELVALRTLLLYYFLLFLYYLFNFSIPPRNHVASVCTAAVLVWIVDMLYCSSSLLSCPFRASSSQQLTSHSLPLPVFLRFSQTQSTIPLHYCTSNRLRRCEKYNLNTVNILQFFRAVGTLHVFTRQLVPLLFTCL